MSDKKDSTAPLAASMRPAARGDAPVPRVASRRWPTIAAGVLSLGCVAQWTTHGIGLDFSKTRLHNGAIESRENKLGAPVKWSVSELPFVVDASLNQIDANAVGAVTNAFSNWRDAGAHVPSVTVSAGEVSSIGYDGQNSIVYAPSGWDAAGAALAVTVLTTNASTGAIVDADIVLNGRTGRFAVINPDAAITGNSSAEVDVDGHDAAGAAGSEIATFDLQGVVTHEAGHALGLTDDLDDENVTMYIKTSPLSINKRMLSDLDRAAISKLYSAAPDDQPAAGCGGATIAGRRRSGASAPAWAAMGIASLAAGIAARRRSIRKRAATGGCVLMASAAVFLTAPASTVVTAASPTSAERAEVVASSSHWVGGLLETDLTLRVGASEHQVTMPGGRVGDIVQTINGSPVPAVGEHVALSVVSRRVAPITMHAASR